jgi:hypothetical protein
VGRVRPELRRRQRSLSIKEIAGPRERSPRGGRQGGRSSLLGEVSTSASAVAAHEEAMLKGESGRGCREVKSEGGSGEEVKTKVPGGKGEESAGGGEKKEPSGRQVVAELSDARRRPKSSPPRQRRGGPPENKAGVAPVHTRAAREKAASRRFLVKGEVVQRPGGAALAVLEDQVVRVRSRARVAGGEVEPARCLIPYAHFRPTNIIPSTHQDPGVSRRHQKHLQVWDETHRNLTVYFSGEVLSSSLPSTGSSLHAVAPGKRAHGPLVLLRPPRVAAQAKK